MCSERRQSLRWGFGGRISEPCVAHHECFGGAVLDAGGGGWCAGVNDWGTGIKCELFCRRLRDQR